MLQHGRSCREGSQPPGSENIIKLGPVYLRPEGYRVKVKLLQNPLHHPGLTVDWKRVIFGERWCRGMRGSGQGTDHHVQQLQRGKNPPGGCRGERETGKEHGQGSSAATSLLPHQAARREQRTATAPQDNLSPQRPHDSDTQKLFFFLHRIFLSTVCGTKAMQTWKTQRRSVPAPQKPTGTPLQIPPCTSQTHQYHPTHPCCTGWSCKITWVLVSSGFSPSFPSLGTTTTSPTGTLTSAFAISHMKPSVEGAAVLQRAKRRQVCAAVAPLPVQAEGCKHDRPVLPQRRPG